MRIGSLFSGAGGLDMGVQAVIGGTIAWHSEIDPGACRVLAHRYPSVPNLGDITAIDWAAVEPVDVLTAGFPCQPVSSAGRQLGDQDERWLWDEVARAVSELRPGLVVLENVRGLLTAGGGRLFGRVVGSLAELGYDATWHGLRASDVGAPHGRFRVFVVAHPAGNPWRVEHGDGGLAADTRDYPGDGQRARPESQQGDSATADTGSEHGQQWRLPAPGQATGGRARREPAGRGGTPTLPTPTARDWKGHNERRDATCLTGALMPTPRASDGTHGGPGQRGSAGDLMLSSAVALLPTPTAMDSRASGGDPRTSNTTLTDATVRNPDLWGKYGPTIRRWEALTRPAPAATQPSARTGNPQLAPRFSEWLMGWPAGWVTDVPDLSRNEQLRIIGNGVVPQQAAAGISWCLDAARQYGGAP